MGRLSSSLQGAQRRIARHCMDRFVARDDGQIFVTARSAATRQSMDRFVPRGDGQIFVTARSAATWQSMDCFVARVDGLYAFQQRI